jgi:hypothetical protein
MWGFFWKKNTLDHKRNIQVISRVVMNPTELEMQPKIHLHSYRGYLFFYLKNIKHS